MRTSEENHREKFGVKFCVLFFPYQFIDDLNLSAAKQSYDVKIMFEKFWFARVAKEKQKNGTSRNRMIFFNS